MVWVAVLFLHWEQLGAALLSEADLAVGVLQDFGVEEVLGPLGAV